ncbi:MAG: AI-2E family transporter [Bacteroidota bacterium]
MKKTKWYIAIPVLILVGFLVWYFSAIIAYILIAAVLSIIGQPLVKLLTNIKIGKRSFPQALSALITLLAMYFVIFFIFWLIIPLIAHQADLLSGVNVDVLSKSFKEPIQYLQENLQRLNLIAPDENIEQSISAQLVSVMGFTQFSNFINSIVGFAQSLLVGIFSVTFITFFFLKDEKLFFKMIMTATPYNYHSEVKHVLSECKRLLTRYFIGLCIDITLIICLLTLGMWLLGLENALMIGVFAGIMNIIPYVGPIIGWAIGLLLGLSGNLGMDFNTEMVPLMLQMTGIFVTINLFDGFVLQPAIYSNSVRSHPLEIFLVILMAGSIAGIPGIMLAIPSYTVLRIIAKEFFNKFYLVKKLTENIDK